MYKGESVETGHSSPGTGGTRDKTTLLTDVGTGEPLRTAPDLFKGHDHVCAVLRSRAVLHGSQARVDYGPSQAVMSHLHGRVMASV